MIQQFKCEKCGLVFSTMEECIQHENFCGIIDSKLLDKATSQLFAEIWKEYENKISDMSFNYIVVKDEYQFKQFEVIFKLIITCKNGIKLEFNETSLCYEDFVESEQAKEKIFEKLTLATCDCFEGKLNHEEGEWDCFYHIDEYDLTEIYKIWKGKKVKLMLVS